MVDRISWLVEPLAQGMELIGVLIIAIGAVISLWRYVFSRHDKGRVFSVLRHDLGKAILLGLEFLVAGDIIATVSVETSLQQVLVLGLVVFIRTFLSFSLEVEIEGQWPWQKKNREHDSNSF